MELSKLNEKERDLVTQCFTLMTKAHNQEATRLELQRYNEEAMILSQRQAYENNRNAPTAYIPTASTNTKKKRWFW